MARAVTIAAGAAALTIAFIAPAAAQSCADAAVSARGEPARLRAVARIKAIGNWRGKVRRLARLGPGYDNWKRAADPVERCIDNESTVVCTVTARPCRK